MVSLIYCHSPGHSYHHGVRRIRSCKFDYGQRSRLCKSKLYQSNFSFIFCTRKVWPRKDLKAVVQVGSVQAWVGSQHLESVVTPGLVQDGDILHPGRPSQSFLGNIISLYPSSMSSHHPMTRVTCPPTHAPPVGVVDLLVHLLFVSLLPRDQVPCGPTPTMPEENWQMCIWYWSFYRLGFSR